MNSLSREPRKRRCTQCNELFMPKRLGLVTTKQCGMACALELALDVNTISKPRLSPKPKKKPAKTIGKLKKQLWDLFSLHQKLVHSTDGEWCNCYTCNKPIKIGTTDCQGGHCLSKAGNPALYFDERSVRPQCYKCNGHYGGMHYEFNELLKQEIGLVAWQDMYDNRKASQKRTRQWYEENILHYSVNNLLIKESK